MFDFSVKDRVATVAMHNEAVNALTQAFVGQLELLMDDLEARNDWSVVIIRSDFKIFSGGGELAGMLSWISGGRRQAGGGICASRSAPYGVV